LPPRMFHNVPFRESSYRPMTGMGHFLPWCPIAFDGRLASDSCRARRMLLTAEKAE